MCRERKKLMGGDLLVVGVDDADQPGVDAALRPGRPRDPHRARSGRVHDHV
jgi:hypothetical protein